MIWMIASIPLWLVGLLFLAAPAWAFCNHIGHKKTFDRTDVDAALISLTISAVALYLAAKVAS